MMKMLKREQEQRQAIEMLCVDMLTSAAENRCGSGFHAHL